MYVADVAVVPTSQFDHHEFARSRSCTVYEPRPAPTSTARQWTVMAYASVRGGRAAMPPAGGTVSLWNLLATRFHRSLTPPSMSRCHMPTPASPRRLIMSYFTPSDVTSS